MNEGFFFWLPEGCRNIFDELTADALLKTITITINFKYIWKRNYAINHTI